MIVRHVVGWLWRFQPFRLLCIAVAQSAWAPSWLINGIWLWTPLPYGLHDLFSTIGAHELRHEVELWMTRHGFRIPDARGYGGGSAP